ncbi:hypothetical protein LshimejAT787_1601770 [Lyophyllum shimeji]|uniref:Uncharacterized protein n=1 Tax=Lyophyllum shimeji TaxID=47721 RepID=A0A9P3UTJ2_LYOSH|nr:hypothetical protein LshimejAT787_1601770 [Lyophyllum shimeji]
MYPQITRESRTKSGYNESFDCPLGTLHPRNLPPPHQKSLAVRVLPQAIQLYAQPARDPSSSSSSSSSELKIKIIDQLPVSANASTALKLVQPTLSLPGPSAGVAGSSL